LGGSTPLLDEPDTDVLDVDDSYDFLPQKVLAFFHHALATSDFEWLFKCDDDTYVALGRLHGLIAPEYDLIGDLSIDHRGAPSGGAGYFLSREMVSKLVAYPSLPKIGAEDVIMGTATKELGGRLKGDERLGTNPGQYPSPNNRTATSHWCPPMRLHVVHSILTATPISSSVVLHSCWTDTVFLYSDGRFMRRSTGCCGIWDRDSTGNLWLRWLDWAAEKFTPESAHLCEGGFPDTFRQECEPNP
jgi:hypothetical protein